MGWDAPPIVIGGCARSGTTLLLSVLSCHPHVYAIPHETKALCRWEYDAGAARAVRLNLIEAELPPATIAHRWMEKTTRNVRAFREILAAIPDVRLLHIIRDGRDVVTSTAPAYEGYLVDAERWVHDVTAGLEYADHPQVLTLRYCDLVRNYAVTVRHLCDWLEEPLVPAFWDYPAGAVVVEHQGFARAPQARRGPARPIDPESIGRWRDPVHADAVTRFLRNTRAVTLLRQLGYQP